MKTLTANSAIAILVGLAVLIALGVWWIGGLGNLTGGGKSQSAAAAAPSLSTVTNFSILGALSAASANTTTISGDLGLSPGLAISRTGPWVVNGTEYFGPSSAAFGAQADALIAFNNLTAQTSDGTWSLNPAPVPGVWTAAGSATFAGPTLTLTGGYNDVWVFQVGSDFTFTGNIVLAGNAQACNVFWEIGRDATIASGSTFVGTLIASRDVVLASGATVNGRIIALHGALTTDANTISGPTCVSAPADTPATLHVIKSVVNVSGTATASDFMVHVKSATSTFDVSGSPLAGASAPGTLYTLPAGAYNVSEDTNPSFPTYSQTFGLDCVGGSFTLAAGDNKICTIINTDIPVPAPAPASAGSSPELVLPLIAVTKIPTPLALPSGPGLVTYIYTVTNIGPVPMTGVWVKDDKCAPATYISGDTNGDSKLDTGEAWIYRCMQTVSQTVTNTATAHGHADGQDAYDTALATVVVGAAVPPPLIAIVKVPSRLTPFPFGGGDVSYTYTVTNPGVVALHDVAVTDDKCAPVSFVSGDTNGNNLLEPGESWTYTCQTHISASTRNTATAKGTGNGLTAIDYAFATVLVAAPGLPNTGLPPEYGSQPQ